MNKNKLNEFMENIGYEISPYYIKSDEKDTSICYIKYPALHSLDAIEFIFKENDDGKVSLEYNSLSDICIKNKKDLDWVNAEFAIMEWDLSLITQALKR